MREPGEERFDRARSAPDEKTLTGRYVQLVAQCLPGSQSRQHSCCGIGVGDRRWFTGDAVRREDDELRCRAITVERHEAQDRVADLQVVDPGSDLDDDPGESCEGMMGMRSRSSASHPPPRTGHEPLDCGRASPRTTGSCLGVALFVRSTRKVELTAAGRSFLDHARAMLASVETAVDEARRVATGHAGRAVLGLTVSATYGVMLELTQALRVDLPEIELDRRGEMLTPVQVAACSTTPSTSASCGRPSVPARSTSRSCVASH